MKTSSTRRRRGFTLIEVLLVLVILVILASLAVVNIISAQKSANLKAAKVQVQLFDDALQNYQLDVQSFPSTATGLQALVSQPADLQDSTKWAGPYLNKGTLPLDPWSKPYQYSYPGQHNTDRPDVWTVSPDGREIGNWSDEMKR